MMSHPPPSPTWKCLAFFAAWEKGEQVAAQIFAVAGVGLRDVAHQRGRGHQPERVRVGVSADARLRGAGDASGLQGSAAELYRGCVFEE